MNKASCVVCCSGSFLSSVCGVGTDRVRFQNRHPPQTQDGEGGKDSDSIPCSLGHPGRSPKGVVCNRHSWVLWCSSTFTPLGPGQTLDVQGRGPAGQKWG